ncbi:RcnB family protein [Asticcacaulis sp. AND118]|uniref:RcnB family protein n=1 Tax=Asticcacaulis sp. AND118 TaxID=2840468 RepID=UPI001CFFD54B|nr:RcnB family protein [Asticcacaulis sp. AND118]UDF02696.1 RcnB family protein [Asticcacaulis sp. AND118]
MKRIVTASILAMMTGSILMADVAAADPRHHDRHDRYERGHDRGDRYDRHDRYDRWDRDDRRGRYDPYRSYDRGRHYGWRERSEWRRGGYVAYRDWDRGYAIDYRRHRHLYAPPRGYEWRHVDDRYVLAAVATGLIAAIVLSN